MKEDKLDFGIITSPFLLNAGVPPLSNLIDILTSFSDDLYVITGNAGTSISNDSKKVHFYYIERKQEANIFIKIVKYFLANLKISYKLAKLSNVDSWFFFMGERPLIISILVAKLMRKDVIYISSGLLRIKMNKSVISSIVTNVLEPLNHVLADKIIIYSERLIDERDLIKYRNKICIVHGLFLDFDKFKIKKTIDERNDLIGYVGRLSEEKGVLNFVKAISKILKEEDNLEFIIGGDGKLRDEIERRIVEKTLNYKVKLVGWIPHDELSDYLNRLKLIVIPSYTEAGPIIAMEAMACGALVLATSVGLVPDIIKDGKTGFIMENNSPECIARNIIRALDHPDLEEITNNARALVEKEFTYGAAVERYRKLLSAYPKNIRTMTR